MKTFESGKTYSTRSICDHDCIFSVDVIKRTAKTVTVNMKGFLKNKRLGINIWDGEETIRPLGSYSMAPIIGATERDNC